MGDDRNDLQTRRSVAGWLTAAATLLPAAARAQMAVAPISPAAPSPPLESTTTVKLAEDLSDRMTVPVMVNGQGPFAFVVDTGSNRTVVSDVLAAQLQLPAGKLLNVSSAIGEDPTPSALISRLVVGKHEITNVTAPVLMRGNLGAAGLLGIDALAEQTVVMDFKAKTMAIQPSARAKDEDPNTVVVRAKSKYGQLILVDAWVEGIQLYVIIDTGGELTIGNLHLRDALLRRRAHTPVPVKVTSVTGAEVEADLSVLPRVLLGHVEISRLQIAYADMHAFDRFGLTDKPSILLGMSSLRYFDRVWVDFKARQVRFQFGDQARMTGRPLLASAGSSAQG
jgi:predicted aspartyl protease